MLPSRRSRAQSAFAAACLTGAMTMTMSASAEADPRAVRKEGAEAVSRKGMVVGTTGGEAQAIGLEILKKGGSAADAAIATAMAQIVLAGGSWVSFAGIYGMVYYDAGQGRIFDLNAEYNTVRGETDPLSIPGEPITGDLTRRSEKPKSFSARAVLVPGFMAGIGATHEKFGKLPLKTVFEPVIQLADKGVPLAPGLVQQIKFREDVLGHWPETQKLFRRGDRWIQAGETFEQKELAATLRQVVKHGTSYMYTGAWAKKFVDIVQQAGSKMTMEDMASYKALWTEPLRTTYKAYKLAVHGMPATGGVALVEALNVLETSDLARYGDYGTSADALYLMSRVTSAALAQAQTPPMERLTKEHAAKLWASIKSGAAAATAPADQGPRHSDGLVVIDQWGNIAAITHSINTVSWGEFGRFVDGVSIPDSAFFQKEAVKAAGPGNRLPSPLEVGLVLKDDKPLLGFASIGAGLHQATVTSLYNVMERGMHPQQAINQPDLGYALPQPDLATGKLNVTQMVGKDEFSPDLLKAASRNGLTFLENDQMRGYWVAIERAQDGMLHGGALRRFDGRGVGY